jgi:ketosteroid isomerase-like protein
MRHSITLISLSVVTAVMACQQPPTQLSEQDRTTLLAMFDSTAQRIRAGNFTAWAAQFSDDARFYAPNARPVIGRAAILAWGQALPPVEEFGFADVQVTGAGDLAYGTSAYSMKLRDLPADSGKQLVVFRRAGSGAWEVVAGSFNSNLPIPQPAAPTPRRR